MNWCESVSDWEQELERCGASGWRVSSVNDRFEMSTRYNSHPSKQEESFKALFDKIRIILTFHFFCLFPVSLPRFIVVPQKVLDTELKKSFAHFNEGRIPVSISSTETLSEFDLLHRGIFFFFF